MRTLEIIEKIKEKLREYTYKITNISAANCQRKANLVPNNARALWVINIRNGEKMLKLFIAVNAQINPYLNCCNSLTSQKMSK